MNFQLLLEQRKLLWKVFVTNSWMIIKQNHEIIYVFMGKILCLHVLQVRDLGKILCLHVLQVKDLLLTQKSSKGTGRKCNERIKDQQPLNSQDVFPTPSFHLPCALTDPGTGGTSSVTCQSKKWWLLKVLMLHAQGIHSPIPPLQSGVSAAQSSLREHGTSSRAGLP